MKNRNLTLKAAMVAILSILLLGGCSDTPREDTPRDTEYQEAIKSELGEDVEIRHAEFFKEYYARDANGCVWFFDGYHAEVVWREKKLLFN